jgi:hypothetical protein
MLDRKGRKEGISKAMLMVIRTKQLWLEFKFWDSIRNSAICIVHENTNTN